VSSFHEINFGGGALGRGFWLYVWEVTPPKGSKLYYVGRTGDSSSLNAQSPFNRMGQHLGYAKNSCMLRTHLGKQKGRVKPEQCKFRLMAYGPILPEANGRKTHQERRDRIAGVEKALADAMRESGYAVMNTVRCRKQRDDILWQQVLQEFEKQFPKLNTKRRPYPG
jgi:hypothetical protein